MRIGLISDTHCPERCPSFPTTLGRAFRDVDLILHAGDVGKLWVLDSLSEIAPVIAVHGNDDTEEAKRELPFRQIVAVAGRRILLWHGHAQDPDEEHLLKKDDSWEPKLTRRARVAIKAEADLLVHGHTHIPMVWTGEGTTLVNPGAIASGGAILRQTVQTVAILDLSGITTDVVHLNLDNPDAPYNLPIDLEAGYAAAAKLYSDSIVVPELEKRLTRDLLPNLEDFASFKKCFLRLSYECWTGRKHMISLRGTLAIEGDPNVTSSDKEKCRAILSS